MYSSIYKKILNFPHKKYTRGLIQLWWHPVLSKDYMTIATTATLKVKQGQIVKDILTNHSSPFNDTKF